MISLLPDEVDLLKSIRDYLQNCAQFLQCIPQTIVLGNQAEAFHQVMIKRNGEYTPTLVDAFLGVCQVDPSFLLPTIETFQLFNSLLLYLKNEEIAKKKFQNEGLTYGGICQCVNHLLQTAPDTKLLIGSDIFKTFLKLKVSNSFVLKICEMVDYSIKNRLFDVTQHLIEAGAFPVLLNPICSSAFFPDTTLRQVKAALSQLGDFCYILNDDRGEVEGKKGKGNEDMVSHEGSVDKVEEIVEDDFDDEDEVDDEFVDECDSGVEDIEEVDEDEDDDDD